jgi:hypothetical protein
MNTTELQIRSFVQALRRGYRLTYGRHESENPEIIAWVGSTALEIIAGSDALYHNVEHTMLVTLVGQEILRGKHIKDGGVTPVDWLHVMVSLICHDIGYVRGICRQDVGLVCATGKGGETVTLPPGSTDAALTPYHVDRGKLFVEERFRDNAHLDVERIKKTIEPTRFPVPKGEDDQLSAGYPSLVRSADLIGQLGDPRYLTKIPALFYEFQETGVNEALGYHHPDDLRRIYPKFYWGCVSPFIQDGLRYLAVTQRGREMRASLYANVFMMEHETRWPGGA